MITTTPNRCCHCFSGKKGIIAIGCVGIVFDISVIGYRVMTGFSEVNCYEDSKDCEESSLENALTISSIVVLIIRLIIDGLLIVGVTNSRAMFMAPWICINFSQLLGIIPGGFSLIAFPYLTMCEVVVTISMLLISFIILSHFLHVVWFHYEGLRRRDYEILHSAKSQMIDNVFTVGQPFKSPWPIPVNEGGYKASYP